VLRTTNLLGYDGKGLYFMGELKIEIEPKKFKETNG
jgi:hypothetical protein